MLPILTLTLNPALDIATAADHVVPGPKLRCDIPRIDPGGGGVNVSRAIAILGGQSHALVSLGGATGDQIAARLNTSGITPIRLHSPGETRQNIAVTDHDTGQQYRFAMPGPTWEAVDLERLFDTLPQHLPDHGLAVFSGSLPPGLPDDLIRRLHDLCVSQGLRLIADTSGAALTNLSTHPGPGLYILRMDHAEAEELAGQSLPNIAATQGFAQSLIDTGTAENVIIAMGPKGSLLVGNQTVFCHAADVPVRSKIGAGDSSVAGLALGLAQGRDMATALQMGVAAASAAVMTDGTALCIREDAERLIADCPLAPLNRRATG